MSSKRLFNSHGTNVLPVRSFVQTKYGERGFITEYYSVSDEYQIRLSYGRAGSMIRFRKDIRPIDRNAFIKFHKLHGNTGMLSIMPTETKQL